MNPEEIRPVVLVAPIRRERTDAQIDSYAANDRLPVGARHGGRPGNGRDHILHDLA